MRINMRLNMTAVFLAAATVVWAQQPLASASSPAAFTLRGVTVAPGQGVSSWPLLPGDIVKAGTAPTTLSFPAGASIQLAPGSEASVKLIDGKPVFQLISGSASYSLSSSEAVGLMQGTQAVASGSLTGVLTAGSVPALAAVGFWTAGHILLLAIGGAAAVGGGLGVAQAVSGGASTSPH
jgi:hypothetical protein